MVCEVHRRDGVYVTRLQAAVGGGHAGSSWQHDYVT